MVLLGVLQPRQALGAVDFPTLILLLGMMLLAAGLNEAGFFAWLTDHTLNHLKPQHLLPAVIVTSGVLSALLVNDVVCVILTPLVLDVTHRMRRAPLPHLLALATASNIGSVATITGNPQNILIASVSHISYVEFFLRLGPVALIGLVADFLILQWIFRKTLHEEMQPPAAVKPALHPDLSFRRMLWPLFILLSVSVSFFAGSESSAGRRRRRIPAAHQQTHQRTRALQPRRRFAARLFCRLVRGPGWRRGRRR